MDMNRVEMNSTGNMEPSFGFFLNITGNQEKGLIGDQAREIAMHLIIYVRLALNIVGIVTNIINARVFVEQGIRNDSTNLAFLCLSLCDLFGCATTIPYEFCFILQYLTTPDKVFTCNSLGIVIIGAHMPLVRVATWTTVYISLIRAVSVVFPLKVKLFFTPRSTVIYLLSVILISTAVQMSYSFSISISWIFMPYLNATVLVVKDPPAAQAVMYYIQLIMYQVFPVIAVAIVTINTALLAHKLIEVKKWRQSNSSSSGSKDKDQQAKGSESTNSPMSSKDIELIKSITAVTSIYLVCVLMGFIPSIAITAFPDVSFAGLNQNLFFITFSLRSLFETINASINFFFYIRVSSRYKEAFATSFKSCSKDTTKR